MDIGELLYAIDTLDGNAEFDQAHISIGFVVDDMTRKGVTISIGLGRWSVSTIGFGPGHKGGSIDDVEGLRSALARIDVRRSHLRVVTADTKGA